MLNPDSFKHYIEKFNRGDRELYVQSFPNSQAWNFLKENIPLFNCPDKDIEEIYYFRWWTFRKHVKKTPSGFVITEFLPPVKWAGPHNTISCAAGHHVREGRWLRNRQYLKDYLNFWLYGEGATRNYSFWIGDSVWQYFCTTGDAESTISFLPGLIENYKGWERERLDSNGLYWQIDSRDGMECSISGNGYRATINTYQFGDASAIAKIAAMAGKKDIESEYREKAASLKWLVEEKLWDPEAEFFKVVPHEGEYQGKFSDVRELHGLTPWYCNLPGADKSVAWRQLMDTKGFYASFGPTTAEQRHPEFIISYQGHECKWNGPSWPFSTSITLTGLANLLNNRHQEYVDKKDYFETLKIYTRSHRLKLDNGEIVPWIDENLNPETGDWISRTRLKIWENGTWSEGKGGEERGKDYNHSTYCDLIINGLIGLRPRPDETVEINPLVPDEWDYFCLDRIPYHGQILTILYDRTGNHYRQGKGLRIISGGKEIASSELPGKFTGKLVS